MLWIANPRKLAEPPKKSRGAPMGLGQPFQPPAVRQKKRGTRMLVKTRLHQ